MGIENSFVLSNRWLFSNPRFGHGLLSARVTAKAASPYLLRMAKRMRTSAERKEVGGGRWQEAGGEREAHGDGSRCDAVGERSEEMKRAGRVRAKTVGSDGRGGLRR
jgi:hypothetical protein